MLKFLQRLFHRPKIAYVLFDNGDVPMALDRKDADRLIFARFPFAYVDYDEVGGLAWGSRLNFWQGWKPVAAVAYLTQPEYDVAQLRLRWGTYVDLILAHGNTVHTDMKIRVPISPQYWRRVKLDQYELNDTVSFPVFTRSMIIDTLRIHPEYADDAICLNLLSAHALRPGCTFTFKKGDLILPKLPNLWHQPTSTQP
jgi:hypothetical protein